MAANIVEDDLTPSVLVQKLEAFVKEMILPDTTLLFFDEIQASERALTSLKYFCEEAPEYHIIAPKAPRLILSFNPALRLSRSR